MNKTTRHSLVAITVALLLAPLAAIHAAERANPSPEQLERYLRRFPDADLDKDGKLTLEEARSYLRRRKSGESPAPTANGRAPSATARPSKQSKRDGDSRNPDFAEVSYGPHERNTLDLWRAKTDRPTPVLVFFHGGSFKAGDKSNVLTRPILEECLKVGISFVSANYRFSSDAPFPAPMHDGARVVQFVRFKAKQWNIDPARIAVSGTSAGATLALWIALHNDLADASSKDPVSRLSTRVTCASPHSGTAGLEPAYFQKQAGVSKLGAALCQLFGAASQAELEAPEKSALVREASPLLHATPDDPPLFLTYAGDPSEAPFTSESAQKAWIHHVCLGLPLKARYDELGIECEFHYASKPPAADAEIAFLKKHLLKEIKTTTP